MIKISENMLAGFTAEAQARGIPAGQIPYLLKVAGWLQAYQANPQVFEQGCMSVLEKAAAPTARLAAGAMRNFGRAAKATGKATGKATARATGKVTGTAARAAGQAAAKAAPRVPKVTGTAARAAGQAAGKATARATGKATGTAARAAGQAAAKAAPRVPKVNPAAAGMAGAGAGAAGFRGLWGIGKDVGNRGLHGLQWLLFGGKSPMAAAAGGAAQAPSSLAKVIGAAGAGGAATYGAGKGLEALEGMTADQKLLDDIVNYRNQYADFVTKQTMLGSLPGLKAQPRLGYGFSP